jgi:hypothetical protein
MIKPTQNLAPRLRGIVSLCMGADYVFADELVNYLMAMNDLTPQCYVEHPYKLLNCINHWVRHYQPPANQPPENQPPEPQDGRVAPIMSEQIL